MAISRADARSYERILRACAAGGDSRALRLRVLEEIRRTVAFDWYAFLLTDPETAVGVAPLADVPEPMLPVLPRLIRLKYLTAVNRWTTIGAGGIALLRQTTNEHPELSLVWRELLGPHGVGDVASLVFRDKHGYWGFLDLWRSGADARFDPADAAFLARIREPITAALRRSQADSFGVGTRRPDRPGPLVLLLTEQLDVVGQTPDSHAYLRALVPPAPDRAPIPASAYNVAAQLLAVADGVDAHAPWARVHLADGRWLTVRAATIADGGIDSDPRIAVSIEECPPAERVDVFARACGLSARETELLGHLVKGYDTRTVAGLMYVSEHTVQDHLKSIFAKTSATNRKALLSRALGT
jgi:DNA-binding CsgD family transcriptional regulator